MTKFFTLIIIIISVITVSATAQTLPNASPATQTYGVVSKEDLEMTSCDFEKDANAMVLFDKAKVDLGASGLIMERHKRIKILNQSGNEQASIRIPFYKNLENIKRIEAETINLDGESIKYTKIDKELLYHEAIDKERKEVIFTFPEVRAGSIIEFKYRLVVDDIRDYPDWHFQDLIPVRYSEFDAGLGRSAFYSIIRKIYQPATIDTAVFSENEDRHIWALSNIKSYKKEPFMDYPSEYLQSVFVKRNSVYQTWQEIIGYIIGRQYFSRKLSNQKEIIDKVNQQRTIDEKIAFIFNTVKNTVHWNGLDYPYAVDGIESAWDKKTGNSTEINMILYGLLKSANIKSSLMSITSRSSGKLDNRIHHLDKTVVYCPVDSANYYVLDASNPNNTFNTIPVDLSGLNALLIDVDKRSGKGFHIRNEESKEIILTTGIISADGKFEGTTQINSSGYGREKYIRDYKGQGEKAYIDKVQRDYHNLEISSLKLENMQDDTLPLIQNFAFKFNLTEPDGQYMYINPNIFNGFNSNPFFSDTRVSNVELGGIYSYSINGNYKIPPGYKVDVLPQMIALSMEDNSISFKRIISAEGNNIIMYYVIDFKKAVFNVKEYPALHTFYKKMFEMLNEQIVLKKV